MTARGDGSNVAHAFVRPKQVKSLVLTLKEKKEEREKYMKMMMIMMITRTGHHPRCCTAQVLVLVCVVCQCVSFSPHLACACV